MSFEHHEEPITAPRPPQYRPWTPEEAVGKTFRYSGDSIRLIERYSDGKLWSGSLTWTPQSLLDTCTQINGSPCGVLIEGGES